MKFLLGLILLLLNISLSAQDEQLEVFALYDSSGTRLNFSEVIDKMSVSEVVLFGEEHDHALIHWLQYQAALALADRTPLVLGGEFFAADDQVLIDEYLQEYIDKKQFLAAAGSWPNYETDYAPLLELAKDSGFSFIGTNIPRRYAAFVADYGSDTLSSLPEESLRFFPPLPLPFEPDIPGYEEMRQMMAGHRENFDADNFVRAQALKDYTMAFNIVDNLLANGVFLHINGDFHSARYGGIYYYIKFLRPRAKVMVVKTYSARSLELLPEEMGSGDIILKVPADFTRTH